MKPVIKLRKGRGPIDLDPRVINKINLMWFLNQRSVTDIARSVGHSQGLVQSRIFPTRGAWDDWQEQMVLAGKL